MADAKLQDLAFAAQKPVPVPAIQDGDGGTVYTPMVMIDRAIASGANIETLERLMALQERWSAAEAKREFDEAMAAAKAEIKPIVKTRSASFGVGKTSYEYEDLAQIAETIDPILAAHGLSYRYNAKQDGGTVAVTCIISHRRGHSEATTLQSGADTSGSKNAIQAVGSAVTYLQRYTLKLALGLAATKDSDGAAPPLAAPKLIDKAQFDHIAGLLEKSGRTEAKLCAWLGIGQLEHMTQAQFKQADAELKKKIAEKGAN